MKCFIASDHAGFELKRQLIPYLEENGIEVIDKGPFNYVAGDDYPDWIALAAAEVSEQPQNTWAIVIGLSGQGEAIAANKFKNVRAGVYYGGPEEILKLLREHNDCNVLSLGAKFLTLEEAQKAVDIWIESQFSNDERHIRRLKKIEALESNHD